jgi:hypothetical protein
MWLHSWGGILDLIHKKYTSESIKVPLHSCRTLLASPVGGPLVAINPPTIVGPASCQGCRLVLAKSLSHTSPTSVHKIFVSYLTPT